MSISQLQKNNHLLLRAGFGPDDTQISNLAKTTTQEIWKKLSATYAFQPLELNADAVEVDYSSLAKMDAVSKKQILQKNRKQTLELNLKFLDKMVYSEDQLREKMAFFWHGHFATRVIKSQFNVQLINVIREKALGNFGDLLVAVSQSPAMLQFLNNQKN